MPVTGMWELIDDTLLIGGILLLALSVTSMLTWLCDRLGGTFADAVRPHDGKLGGIEGLRGVLALAVVAHHASCWFGYTNHGVWAQGSGMMFLRLGPFGTVQFFYISGFLFWRKLMKGPIDLKLFYLSRFVRIAPVYYVGISLGLLLGLTGVGFGLHQPLLELAQSAAVWGTFTIFGQPNLDAVDLSRITSGVTWTLGSEWLFYLALPLFGWFSRKRVRLLHFGATMVAFWGITKFLTHLSTSVPPAATFFTALHGFSGMMFMGFGGGIVLAALDQPIRQHLKLSKRTKDFSLIALYLLFLMLPEFPGFSLLAFPMMFVGFALILQGADLFGMLTWRPTRFLGLISYDLYLTHGITYFAAARLRGGLVTVPGTAYIVETAGCLVVILLLATVLHFTLERPSMRKSEAIARKAGRPMQPVAG